MAASTSAGWIMVKVMEVPDPAASAAVGEPASAGGRRRRCHGASFLVIGAGQEQDKL